MLQGLAAALADGRNMSVDNSPGQADSSSTADMLQSSSSRDFGRILARRLARRRGGLYCVLQCEGQTKHTALVSSSRPAWKQELSFKSVQISSDLQVSSGHIDCKCQTNAWITTGMLSEWCCMSGTCEKSRIICSSLPSNMKLGLQITLYRKGRMGTDHFLGETLVPLREVEEVDGGVKVADVRRYTLGRRSARDKVGMFVARMSCLGAQSRWHCLASPVTPFRSRGS